MTEQKNMLPEERIAQLEARVDELQKRVLNTQTEAAQALGVGEVALTHLLLLLRWAFSWSKRENYTKRLGDIKIAGEVVKDTLANIEPSF